MTRVLSEDGVLVARSDINRLVAIAPAIVRELDRRAALAMRDGYPTGGGGVSGGSTATPTEAAALSNTGSLERDIADVMVGAIHRARVSLAEAEQAAQALGVYVDLEDGIVKVRRPATPKVKASLDDTWCRSHARFNLFVPRGSHGRRGLCGFCEGYGRDERFAPLRKLVGDELPPEELLRRIGDAGRLTPSIESEVTHLYRVRAKSKAKRRRRL